MSVHPLLHRDTSTNTSTSYASTFTGNEPFLRDHRVHGQRVLPGAAYVEMVRAALVAKIASNEARVVRLQNLAWMRPFVAAGAPVDLHLRLTGSNTDEALRFEFHDGTEEEGTALRGVYCRGLARLSAPSDSGLGAYDLDALLARCTPAGVSIAQYYQRFEALGLEYGPSYRGMAALYIAPDLVLARLKLPEFLRSEASRHTVHPTLLDAALQASIAMPEALGGETPGVAAVPFWVRDVWISPRAGEFCWAVLKRRTGGQDGDGTPRRAPHLDLDLCDGEGAVLARLEGYTAKPMRKSGNEAPKRNEQVAPPPVTASTQAGSRSLLKRLRGAEGEPSVYCIAAGGTSPLSYFPLAKALDGLALTMLDQRALLEDRPALRTILEAATAFVEALVADSPRGPYLLVGHSYGGSIAFEMARQFENVGQAVSLCMIDSPFYGTVAEEGAAESVGYFVPEALASAIRENPPDEASMLATLTAAAKKSILRDLGAAASKATGVDEMATLYARQMMLYQSYRPSGMLAGDMHLVLASESVLGGLNLPRTLEHYRRYISGSLQVATVAGGHLSLLKRENVASVAAVLRARADAVFAMSTSS